MVSHSTSSAEVRAAFLEFFQDHGHRRIQGASLIPRNDPTLLFVNSGMAPLKRYFTGEERPPHPDLCNVQPCIRTIDIADVGDRHHLTLFEMLGSWSIDHYFKERAIELAFELLTTRLGFDPAQLYATVFAGDPALPLPGDDVSPEVWERVGIPRDHIVPLGLDNFWGPAGDTGPCGPCTEVFFDFGDDFGPAWQPGQEFVTTSRYIEIWNAGVFMEYDKRGDGGFEKLPFTSVDTGSGLERLVMAMNRQDSVYDTDLLAPIVNAVAAAMGGHGQLSDDSRRLVADHLRAATFILGEGVRPSNEGAGYIPRRLIRKAIAVTHRAGAPDYDIEAVVDLVISCFGEHYPRLHEGRDAIRAAFTAERDDFRRVIARGLDHLEGLTGTPPFSISGRDAFHLFATYGLPLDIVRDVAHERGGEVDVKGYEREFATHQSTSRVLKRPGGGEVEDWPSDDRRFAGVDDSAGVTEFLGYAATHGESTVLGLCREGSLVERVLAGDRVEVITSATPFYAESGGQVGDTGTIRDGDATELTVLDTVRSVQGYHVHRALVERGSLRVGEGVALDVDEMRRAELRRNHSATHLLQAVLRDLLGDHVHQAGSLVEPTRLRFDFTHPRALTREQLYEVERRLNRAVFADYDGRTEVVPYAEAVSDGALSMEGEKYGDKVRVVHFGNFSVELCGGTHVAATADINLFRIVSESSVASGVRRIVAITGEAAVDYTLHRDAILAGVAQQLRVGIDDVPERVGRLARGAKKRPVPVGGTPSAGLGDRGVLADGTPYHAGRGDGDPATLRRQAAELAGTLGGPVVLVGEESGQARVVAAVPRTVEARFDANAILRQLLPLIDGRGGGNRGLAMGGGPSVDGLGRLLEAVAGALEPMA